MKNKNILISGAGVAGLTLAYWLKQYGFSPTLVEKSPYLRTSGYKALLSKSSNEWASTLKSLKIEHLFPMQYALMRQVIKQLG